MDSKFTRTFFWSIIYERWGEPIIGDAEFFNETSFKPRS